MVWCGRGAMLPRGECAPPQKKLFITVALYLLRGWKAAFRFQEFSYIHSTCHASTFTARHYGALHYTSYILYKYIEKYSPLLPSVIQLIEIICEKYKGSRKIYTPSPPV